MIVYKNKKVNLVNIPINEKRIEVIINGVYYSQYICICYEESNYFEARCMPINNQIEKKR